MTPSDIVAIVAIIVSAIVSTLATFIAYKNNQTTISAKRKEIALERQLDAFSEITEKVGELSVKLNHADVIFSNHGNAKKKTEALNAILSSMENLVISYARNEVYLPSRIMEQFSKLASALNKDSQELLVRKDFDNLKKIKKDIIERSDSVIIEMQEFIGVG
jgi:hypothetical protein